jgi:hypothetical protein
VKVVLAVGSVALQSFQQYLIQPLPPCLLLFLLFLFFSSSSGTNVGSWSNWQMEGYLLNDTASAVMWECPDLFPLLEATSKDIWSSLTLLIFAITFTAETIPAMHRSVRPGARASYFSISTHPIPPLSVPCCCPSKSLPPLTQYNNQSNCVCYKLNNLLKPSQRKPPFVISPADLGTLLCLWKSCLDSSDVSN